MRCLSEALTSDELASHQVGTVLHVSKDTCSAGFCPVCLISLHDVHGCCCQSSAQCHLLAFAHCVPSSMLQCMRQPVCHPARHMWRCMLVSQIQPKQAGCATAVVGFLATRKQAHQLQQRLPYQGMGPRYTALLTDPSRVPRGSLGPSSRP